MLSCLSLISRTISFVISEFQRLSQPNPKYYKDKFQYQLAHKRNQAISLLQVCLGIGFSFNIFIENGAASANIQGVLGSIFLFVGLFVSCRFHPEIFRIIYNIFVLSFGAVLIITDEQGIFGAWLVVPIFPIVVYLFTASIWHFAFNAVCQIICLNTFYQKLMAKSLMDCPIDVSVKTLTYYLHQSVFYIILFVVVTHYTVQNAFFQLKVAEKKKDDFEKQKNFLLGFSHELRNLINSLMGNVKLASLENLTEKAKDLLLNAEVCSELLLHLVNNILDTGKAEIGDLEINPVPTRIYDTMERIWSICSELIKRKNLKGRMKINKNLPQILTLDHYRLTQIFLNLVGNAVKYTDTGYVDISVDWISNRGVVNDECFEPIPFNDNDDQDEGIFEKNQALSTLNDNLVFLSFLGKKVDRMHLFGSSVSARKGILKISVSDTGCGIFQEDLDKLFQRFTQVTSDPSKKKLGTGLGLFITKELCQRMKGEVKAFSKKQRGTAFVFCLPVEPVAEEKAFLLNFEEIPRIASYQRLRAMVVDDEQMSQIILRDFLTKLNVEVVDIAGNGLMAYKRFAAHEERKEYVNIVTMDLSMPVFDGKASAKKIREFEAEKHLDPCLLIIVSGNCSESEIKECIDKNGRIRADAFIKKPVSIDELCRVISSHYAKSYEKQRAGSSRNVAYKQIN